MSLQFSYDEATDTAEIEGVKYAGELFRSFGHAEPGTWLRIDSRNDGALTLATVREDIGLAFDYIAGRK